LAYWFVVVLGVLVDQAVKAAVRATLAVGERAPLLPGVVELYRVENTGAAFSMGRGAGLLFVVVALAVVAVSLFLVWHESFPMPLVITVSAVAAGGLGNMLDRLASGSVTDFIATTFVSFPVFNVADILVTCGVFLSLVGYFVWGSRRSRLS
jgi:signal peptidase II